MDTETAETPEALLVEIDRRCKEIGHIHDGYRDMGTYGCAGEANEILVLVKRLRALLGLPA